MRFFFLVLIALALSVRGRAAEEPSQTIAVQIYGGVQKQGACRLPLNEPLRSAIETATGGLSGMPQLNRVRITRKRPDGTYERIEFNLKEKAKQPVGSLLKDGDIIYVPELVE